MTNGENCACDALDELMLTQPTLSHHLKILHDYKLNDTRKDVKWAHYSLNEQNKVLERITNLLV